MPPKRYFVALSEEKTMKAGAVSEDLREALSLDPDKLPIWIYRMRILGYPPGWLKVADMTKTVVPFFNEGKTEESDKQEDSTYNVDSLVTFPGFNAPIPPGIKDDYKLLRMPPMMEHQRLDVAVASMNKPKPVPFKRVKIFSPKNDDNEEGDSKEPHVNRLELLEKAKLNESDERTKLISQGVVVPESYLVKKPPLEKWSENNSLADLVYFENLPNSTGTFDKMRSVLGSVRANLAPITNGTSLPETTVTEKGQEKVSEDNEIVEISQTSNSSQEVLNDDSNNVVCLQDDDDDDDDCIQIIE